MRPIEDARAEIPCDEYDVLRAKLEVAVEESKADPEKCKLHFGHFETSDGGL